MAKLMEADVRTMRDLHARKAQSVKEMAQFYGVSAETVRRLLRGETWNHLSMNPQRSEVELQAEADASLAKVLAQTAAVREKLKAGDKMLDELSSEEILERSGV